MGIETILAIAVGQLVVLGVERWLGETDKTEANSIAKLAENMFIAGFKKLVRKA